MSATRSSLHQRIRSEIERKIVMGVWPPGHRIPYEHELMAQYGCARMTVNKAIGALVEAGLVIRKRRAGSFVAPPRIQSVVLEIPDIQAEIQQRGQRYGYRLLRSQTRAASKDGDEQTLAAQGRLLSLSCLHLANDRPFALESRLISLTAVPEASQVDFSATPPGSWLLAHVAWTEAQHRISAIAANAEQAERLALPPGAACLRLDRQTWRGGDGITHAELLFPGDAYALLARFSPSRA